ncbi:hypothetical protein D9611_008595 [Ephemerocybe angulata]|uniref:F-box domain-containing protein n=1 Tax=Ephemerocybe angulata TaxID=980116 RepID=A0A8H5AYR1_9AGAR|nr:hypothetical protein D9611_008595 [Tulosesus angulatus]
MIFLKLLRAILHPQPLSVPENETNALSAQLLNVITNSYQQHGSFIWGDIIEDKANDEEPRTLSSLPPELLCKIFLNVLDPPHTVHPHFDSSGNAVEMLNITHVSSYIRGVALGSAALWATTPFLNNVHPDFLQAMLSRSQPLPISLSFYETEDLLNNHQLWNTVYKHFPRVRRLHAVAGPTPYDDTTIKRLLSIAAPSLVECTIEFPGYRNVCLDTFSEGISEPFCREAPNLRTIELGNCFFPPKQLLHLPKLAKVMVQYLGEPSVEEDFSFFPAQDLLHCTTAFDCLRDLALVNCLRPAKADTEVSTSRHSLYLPSLQQFTIDTSIQGCQELSRIINLPSSCARSITITFPSHLQYNIDDAATAARAAIAFVPLDVRYSECLVGMEEKRATFRLLSAHPQHSAFCLRLDISQLNAHFSSSSIFDAGSLPHILLEDLTITNVFIFQAWTTIAFDLQATLLQVPSLHLLLDCFSHAPYLIIPILQSLPNITEVRTNTADFWVDTFAREILSRANSPRLTTVSIPIHEAIRSPEALKEMGTFLRARPEVKDFKLLVPPPRRLRWVGVVAWEPQAVHNAICDIREELPASVNTSWFMSTY